MLALRRFQLPIVALVAAAVLAACGGAPAAPAPTTAPAPTPKPTLTPRPSPKPKPTAAPTAEPTAEPTSDADAGLKLRDVEIGQLTAYAHTGKLFTIDVPENWTLKDTSKPGEAIAVWTDPAENAFMQVDIFESTQQTPAELASLLKNYLEKTFGNQPDFTQDEAKESGPSMLIVWSYTAEGSNNVTAKLLGNSFIKQVGDKVSLFTLVVPDEQFDRLQPALDKILGSYEIDDTAALSADDNAATGEVTIAELAKYSYKNGLFSIDVPSNWAATDNSKPGEAIVLWGEPSGRATIVIDIFGEAKEQTQDELTAFLTEFLNKTFGAEQDFAINDPKPQSDGSVLLVWTYSDKNLKLKALGNSFIEQRGDKVSILSVVVPDEQFDQLLPKTNEVIQSYSIDASAELP